MKVRMKKGVKVMKAEGERHMAEIATSPSAKLLAA